MKVWIRGNAEHPDKVLKRLEDLGAVNKFRHPISRFGYEDLIFFIEKSGSVCCADDNTAFAEALMTHPDWAELYIEPDYKFQVGDMVGVTDCGGSFRISGRYNYQGEAIYSLETFITLKFEKELKHIES